MCILRVMFVVRRVCELARFRANVWVGKFVVCVGRVGPSWSMPLPSPLEKEWLTPCWVWKRSDALGIAEGVDGSGSPAALLRG